MHEKSWFEVKNTSPKTYEIYIMGDIVDEKWVDTDVTPDWFKDQMDMIKDSRNLHIFVNSGGGSLFAALAIRSMIKNSKAYVTTHIMGVAASSASWMIMPSNKIVMPKNALMMLHLPSIMSVGNKNDFLENISFLEKVEKVILDSYMRGSNKITSEKISEMLNARETWLDGQEAYNVGFVDYVEPAVQVANKGNYVTFNGINYNPKDYDKFPEVVMQSVVKEKEGNLENPLTKYFEQVNDVRNRLIKLQRRVK